MKNIYSFFLSENCSFLEVNFSIYLDRRVFVMTVFDFQNDQNGFNDPKGNKNISRKLNHV